jgi:hypothetical protein
VFRGLPLARYSLNTAMFGYPVAAVSDCGCSRRGRPAASRELNNDNRAGLIMAEFMRNL